MGDGLPEKLYTAWRSSQADPTAHPSWGNVDAETRQAWEAVAIAARGHMADGFVAEIRFAVETDSLAEMARASLARWSR